MLQHLAPARAGSDRTGPDGAPVSGAYKVDISRGERIGRVSSEWFSRPDDERYLSLGALHEAVSARTVESRAIRVEASRDELVARKDEDSETFLRKRGSSKGETDRIIATVLDEEGHPPASIYDFVQDITALARQKSHQDARLELEAKVSAISSAIPEAVSPLSSSLAIKTEPGRVELRDVVVAEVPRNRVLLQTKFATLILLQSRAGFRRCKSHRFSDTR